MLGILIAFLLVNQGTKSNHYAQRRHPQNVGTDQSDSGGVAVQALAIGARDVPSAGRQACPVGFKSLGKPFMIFMIIVGIFDLGNSSDAFLVLRAQERGMSVTGILAC